MHEDLLSHSEFQPQIRNFEDSIMKQGDAIPIEWLSHRPMSIHMHEYRMKLCSIVIKTIHTFHLYIVPQINSMNIDQLCMFYSTLQSANRFQFERRLHVQLMRSIWQTEYHSIEMILPTASKDVLMILMIVINGAQIHFHHFVSRQFKVCMWPLWWSNCLITRQLIIHSDRLCFTIWLDAQYRNISTILHNANFMKYY